MSNKIINTLHDLIAPVVYANGLELYDLEFVKEGTNWILRVFIDKPNGVDINDCELVNRKLNSILDEADPIEQSYILEVSSPGIERVIKTDTHYRRYVGYNVKINLFTPIDNSKSYTGQLVDVTDEYVTLGSIQIPRNNIALCRLS